jgi:DNA invertase Pin-like site-specific DNA recombinase
VKQAPGEDGRGVIHIKEEISMIIGYAQVSTVEQGLDLQKEALEQGAIDRLFTDVASAAKAKRPQLTLALSQLRAGDTFVVWKLDGLGLRLARLVDTIEELTRRGIGFRSLTEGIDTTAGTTTGELTAHLFATLAQLERDLIRERADAYPARRPAQGRRRGRRSKLDEQHRALAVALHKDPSNSIADICQRLGIGRMTLYRYLAEKGHKEGRDTPPCGAGGGSAAEV